MLRTGPGMRSALWSILLIAVLAYAMLCVFFMLFQRSFLYQSPNQEFRTCPSFKSSDLHSENGTRFYLVLRSPRVGIVYHSNFDTACDRGAWDARFRRQNISTLLVEYAGYADNPVQTTQRAIERDVEHIISFLSKRNLTRVVVVGESFGTGPAAYHASLTPVETLILIAPFSRLSDVAAGQFPYLPARHLLIDEFDNIAALSQFQGRTVIMHPDTDRLSTPESARQLYNSLPGQKSIAEYQNSNYRMLLENPEAVALIDATLSS
jgi:uncharacterized protein